MSPRAEKTIDDWGRWVVRGLLTGTCIFMIRWGYAMSEKMDTVINVQSVQVEKNKTFDERNETQDYNIRTLFNSREELQKQISELWRYHPKED